MSSPARLLFGTAALVALAACSANDSSNPSAITAPDNSSLSASSTGQTMRYLNARVCPGSVVGTARCHSWVRVDPSGRPVTNATPRGYGPADLQSAYNLPSTTGSTWSWNGKTIAIVDAYDAPTAEQDLATYRSYFKLPPCSTANGCFRKVNQTGGTTPPAANASWAQEISLDLDMASAICPSCKIVLVEASSNSRTRRSMASARRIGLRAPSPDCVRPVRACSRAPRSSRDRVSSSTRMASRTARRPRCRCVLLHTAS